MYKQRKEGKKDNGVLIKYDKPLGTQCTQWRTSDNIKLSAGISEVSSSVTLDPKSYRLPLVKKRKFLRKHEMDLKDSGNKIRPTNDYYNSLTCEVERIIKLLERSADKIKIVGRSEELIANDGKILKQCLNEKKSKIVLDNLRDNVWALKKNLKNVHVLKTGFKVPACVMEAFRLLLDNNLIHAYINATDNPLSPFFDRFQKYIFNFIKQINMELNETAKEHAENLIAYARCVKNIKYYSDDLKTIEEQLPKDLQAHEKRMEHLNVDIERIQQKIKEEKENHAKKISEIRKHSQEILVKNQDAHLRRIRELEKRANKLCASYDETLEKHLASEKKLHLQKAKLEVKLENFIGRFDHDVMIRHEQQEKLSDLYDNNVRELFELNCLLCGQEERYNLYVAEKKEEEQRVFENKFKMIRMKAAARVIQRSWRAYRVKRKSRKHKGKKGRLAKKGIK